jgi:carboxyl-terminal processing protease
MRKYKENGMVKAYKVIPLIVLCLMSSSYIIAGPKAKKKDVAAAKSRPTILRVKTKRKKVAKQAKDPKDLNSPRDIFQWLKTYSEVISIAEKKAFRTVDFSQFIQDSLKAAASEIDAHSAFLVKESYSSAMESTSGEFPGIGVSIMSKVPEDDTLVIIEVVDGGPAQKAGIQRADKIVEVDGKKLRNLSSDEVIALLKGKVGSTVKVKVLRDKKPFEFTVTRDLIKDQMSSSYFFPKQNIYYFSLKMFNETAASQVSELLGKANKGGCKGIVFDLRRNPGGVLQSAIEMAGLFVDKRSLVAVTKDKNKNIVDQYYSASAPVLHADIPIFILIDNFTASAAEILAGSLRYHSIQSYEKSKSRRLMVFLLGTTTFGKGSVQEVIPLSNGCALKLTSMLYFLPGDISIQATGIDPDFTIKPKFIPADELKWITEMYGKESSLKRHITVKEVTGKEPAKKEGNSGQVPANRDDSDDEKPVTKQGKEKELLPHEFEEKQREELSHDVQVQAAVNMINMLSIARKCDPRSVNTREKALQFIKNNYLTDDKIEVAKVK